MRKFKYRSFNSDSNNIHIIFDDVVWDEKPHIHDFIEIIYIASGQIIETINNVNYESSKGNLLILNTKDIHSFKKTMPSSYYNICFYEESVENIANQSNVYSALTLNSFLELQNKQGAQVLFFEGQDRREIENAMSAMFLAQKNPSKYQEIIEQSYLNIIFAKIIEKINKVNVNQTDVCEKIKAYVDSNLDSDLTLKTMANLFYYNEAYLCRLFKKRFGINYYQYVQNRRIEQAKFLLKSSNDSIEKIAEQLGFSTKNAFYKMFKKETNMTPYLYRTK